MLNCLARPNAPTCQISSSTKRQKAGSPEVRPPVRPQQRVSCLKRAQINCRRLAVTTALQVIRQFLAFAKTAHAGALDRRDVYENVRSTFIWLHKTVTFLAVEPLHCTSRHLQVLRGGIRLTLDCRKPSNLTMETVGGVVLRRRQLCTKGIRCDSYALGEAHGQQKNTIIDAAVDQLYRFYGVNAVNQTKSTTPKLDCSWSNSKPVNGT